jgi:hypothetical protein
VTELRAVRWVDTGRRQETCEGQAVSMCKPSLSELKERPLGSEAIDRCNNALVSFIATARTAHECMLPRLCH